MTLSQRFLSAALLGLGLTLSLGLVSAGLALAQPSATATPEITVHQEAERTLREYRINGRLYAIEIRPHQGASFFLIDHDGNGNFERQPREPSDIPEWALAP